MNSKRQKIVCAAFLAPIAIFGSAMALLNQFGQADRAQKADAIILFGARVYPGAVASPILRNRTRHAFNLWKRGLAPQIVCTGGVGDFSPAEAVVEARLLENWGVPQSAIFRDELSTSTCENAENAARLLPKNAHVIAVSDPYHLWRAQRDLEKMGLHTTTSPALEGWNEISVFKRFQLTAREVFVIARDLTRDFVRGDF